MKIKKWLTSLFAFTLVTLAHAQTPNKAKLDEFFDQLSKKNKAMGSLIIAKDGNVLYTRSIGYSQINESEKKPLTQETRYRIGSITKMFTAVMIFQLVEEKKLKLTDMLNKFFPQIPNANKITIMHILAHRSGIPDFTENRDYRGSKTEAKTQSEMIALIAKGIPDFEPDAKYAYSNSGYILLGYIVEKLTGKSYAEALNQRITSKIALKDTYSGLGKTDTGKNESFSFGYFGNWKQEADTHLSIPGGAGAIISTPSNLAKFIQELFKFKLISQENLDQMMQHNLGMETFTYNGKTGYGYTGGIDGFGSWLVYLPEEKLAVAYTTNGKVYPVTNIMDGIFNIYWNKPFTIPTFETIAINTEVLDKYVGIYGITGAPAKFTITREGTTLYAQPPGQTAIALEATAQDKFKIDPPGIIFEFDPTKNHMILKRNGGERIFTKEK